VRNLFARQAIPMVWDYAEAPPFGRAAGAPYYDNIGTVRSVHVGSQTINGSWSIVAPDRL
jgi:hypothetical protein